MQRTPYGDAPRVASPPIVEANRRGGRPSGRVTGHLKLIERREGRVWYAKTRVPGRTPEQTTRRLAPAHLAGGKPPAGSLTRRQAQDALADLLAAERRRVGDGSYDHQPGAPRVGVLID